jgi:hypothetical protein
MAKLAQHFALTLGLVMFLLSLTWGQIRPPAAQTPAEGDSHDMAMPGMNHDVADSGEAVHVYPFEKTPEAIWAVDRGHRHRHME